MILKDVLSLLGGTDDIRVLEKDTDGFVTVSDLFLNGDGYVRLEEYHRITKEQVLKELSSVDEYGNTDCGCSAVDTVLSYTPLYTLFEEDENTDQEINIELIDDLFDGVDIDNLLIMDYNEAVIDFMNSDLTKLVFRANNLV
jgi:hypothetical protein